MLYISAVLDAEPRAPMYTVGFGIFLISALTILVAISSMSSSVPLTAETSSLSSPSRDSSLRATSFGVISVQFFPSLPSAPLSPRSCSFSVESISIS